MRLVTSMMTQQEMSVNDIQIATDILKKTFQKRATFQKFKFNDRIFFETDIDLFDVNFSKEKIHQDIMKLIFAYENIIQILVYDIEFIAANDDTEVEILRYEKNRNDIKDFGLFVTKRSIHDIEPYYSSEICKAYFNLLHVSFGL